MFKHFLMLQTIISFFLLSMGGMVIGATLNLSKDWMLVILMASFIFSLPMAWISLEGFGSFMSLFTDDKKEK